MVSDSDMLKRLRAAVHYLRDCYRQQLDEVNRRELPIGEIKEAEYRGEGFGIASCCDRLDVLMREQGLGAGRINDVHSG